MMRKDVWQQKLLSAIKEIADKRYQDNVWLEKNPMKCSSYTEAICRLFDDFDLDGYLKKYCQQKNFNDEPCHLLQDLRDILTKFDATLVNPVSDIDILKHPKWKLVIAKAQHVLDAF
jgi:hypothetical protein